ncbi:MAG: hypothetical protein K8R16_00165 [Anaerolineales bacterium]|nr:hypothetical protein [Anaerolineales bacterium]
MKLVITMAGEGKRFREVGFEEPKHMIKVNNTTLFHFAISSLNDFFDETFIFITQKKHQSEKFIQEECHDLGISNFEILQISEITDGQATTAYLADSLIKDSEPVVIYNIDTYVEKGELLKKYIVGDGFIPIFAAEGDQWSFVKLDDNDFVTAVAEKEKISDLATIGFYYFGKWEYFKEAYTEQPKLMKNKYKEKYVAPLYQWMIKKNMKIQIKQIDEKKVHVLGTPEDVVKFNPSFGIMEEYSS